MEEKPQAQRGEFIFLVCMAKAGDTLRSAHIHAIPGSFQK